MKVNSSEETSPGGILLPSSAQKKPTQGEIVAAGTAKSIKVRNARRSAALRMCGAVLCRPNNALNVQEGETVVYSKYAGTELKVSGGDYVILKVGRGVSLPLPP